MNLQPLYDVKERLEQAAIAGTGLLAEDFRLRRAAESLKPLAAASPVFAKIDSGLQALLTASLQDRGGQLLDLLALTDAVAYTQGGSGMDGDLEPLPSGVGTCQPLSYGQLHPLLEALTGTGGGRMNQIKDTWENHPEYFGDFRVLPSLILGLGESYAELADLNVEILKAQSPEIVPLLKSGFDPAGKKDMVRRVEVISALEGPAAAPWLKDILPAAKKEVRTAVITALGSDAESTELLLELAKSERGANRDAALQGLALREGQAVSQFWEKESAKNIQSVRFLTPASSDWASDLAAASLKEQLGQILSGPEQVSREGLEALQLWLGTTPHKVTPAMLDFWRWADAQTDAIKRLQNHDGQPLDLAGQLTDWLLYCLCRTGPGPLCDLSSELWEKHTDQPRWLPHALLADLFTRSAAEVYERFSPCIVTKKPMLGSRQKLDFHTAILLGLGRVQWEQEQGRHIVSIGRHPTAQPLDSRWIDLLIHAVQQSSPEGQRSPFYFCTGETIDGFDTNLLSLVNPSDQEMCAAILPWLRGRAVETGRWNTYSRWLLKLGRSPLGILGDSMQKSKKAVSLYSIWNLLNEAARILPAEEIISLLEEIQSAHVLRKEDASGESAFSNTAALLRADRPFPEWNEFRQG